MLAIDCDLFDLRNRLHAMRGCSCWLDAAHASVARCTRDIARDRALLSRDPHTRARVQQLINQFNALPSAPARTNWMRWILQM